MTRLDPFRRVVGDEAQPNFNKSYFVWWIIFITYYLCSSRCRSGNEFNSLLGTWLLWRHQITSRVKWRHTSPFI